MDKMLTLKGKLEMAKRAIKLQTKQSPQSRKAIKKESSIKALVYKDADESSGDEDNSQEKSDEDYSSEEEIQ